MFKTWMFLAGIAATVALPIAASLLLGGSGHLPSRL